MLTFVSLSQTDPIEAMDLKIKEKMDEYAAKTTRQKYLTNEKYIAFRTSIWVRLRIVSHRAHQD